MINSSQMQWFLCGLFALSSSTILAADKPSIDFAHEIVPILGQHCESCHGGFEAKGSFSINTRDLILNSGYVESGDPENSYLIELLTSDDPDSQMPPPDKPRVPAEQIEKLKEWIRQGVHWEEGFSFAPATYEPPLHPRRPELPPVRDGRSHPVDRILGQYFEEQNQSWPEPIDDAAFLRRASMDLVGLLPTPEELQSFLADPSADKRASKIKELLARDADYAEHWLTFFNDLLRNDYSGTGFITGGRSQITSWLYDSLLSNKPFDQFTRELIAPTAESKGFIDGIQWRGDVNAAQTLEIQFAQSISQSFLGINMKCASCHDSFVDRWKLDEAYGLAAIYAEKPLEMFRCEKTINRTAKASWLFPELGQINAEAPRQERLEQLAGLMTHPDNGRFTRTIVNRLWYRLMGRGIVHPLDAMQSEPWNEDLLDYLAITFSDQDYDLKSILELIATSEIYQSHPELITGQQDGYVFKGPRARRMTAEQFLDGVWQITQAAPKKFDAPVFRGQNSSEVANVQPLTAKWITANPEDSAEFDKPATLFRKPFDVNAEVLQGAAVFISDVPFRFYVNNRIVLEGDGTKPFHSQALHQLLAGPVDQKTQKRSHQFVVIAENPKDQKVSPKLFFEARIKLANGEILAISSDESWQCSVEAPQAREANLGRLSKTLVPVAAGASLAETDAALSEEFQKRLFEAFTHQELMVRASLMKNDFLMKSLGRPGREQIVSMRPDDLTTLEAIDLSNGPIFFGALVEGAKTLLAKTSSSEELVNHIYQFALSRQPTEEEFQLATAELGETPSAESVEDFLWAVFMTPEFILVR